ncbi:hypothetical protein [Neorhizobium sp. T6_25]|uniref:hypothetical protein n=1 Tax=Neorhizobium sp. T6_25 TaxID=2093833 RepID=UPI00155E128C|nr:hypothetical protein [Neorhizobium sp. T6_25]
MANTKCIIDVPLIAKKARDEGNPDQVVVTVTLPDGTKIDLVVFPFGAPREPIQAGDSCNGICW